MAQNKLKFCLVVDVEGFSMFNDLHPRWKLWQKFKFKINYIIKDIKYDKNGFYKLYDFCVSEKFPVSFMLVGSKFKPLSYEKFVDWGYHTLNHKRLTILNDEELEKEVKNIYNCKSFSAPMWMIENGEKPKRIFNILKKEGYGIAMYRGTDKEIIEEKHFLKVLPVKEKYGLKIVNTSNVFHGGFSKERINLIKKDILKNINHDRIYCIATHDFANKNMKNFKEIIYFAKKLKGEGKLKIINLKELVYGNK
ncbi:MAG: hypothetical protein U9Q06_00815 [Nanoarchaeota archaeon]|nr:hypothetical protein [Nanoarchaeota archaeon]